MASETFQHEIFSSEKITAENFSHRLFGIEINANENKANYGIVFD